MRGHRKVNELYWAKTIPVGPWSSKPRYSRASQARGKRYERLFGQHLASLSGAKPRSEQWFRFEDDNGLGHCQPDHYLLQPGEILLYENKLTYRRNVWAQLEALYVPVLEEVFELPCRVFAVCKYLTEKAPIERLTSVEDSLKPGGPKSGLIHWLN